MTDKKPFRPFRSAVLRGLAYFMPPLLTIVIFFWLAGTVQQYVLEPVENLAQRTLAWSVREVVSGRGLSNDTEVIDGFAYRRTSNGDYVPAEVYDIVYRRDGEGVARNLTGEGLWERYVSIQYLKPYIVIPVFLALFILILYVLGKLLSVGLGRIVWNLFENLVNRVPFVRNVYSWVKQVTDFLFNQHSLEFTRVVAIEYPSKGIWTIGFVTGEGLLAVREACGEPVVSVLVPTSPMGISGYTCIVLKRDTLELNITVEHAFKYIMSCGVVLPQHELRSLVKDRAAGKKFAAEALAAQAGDETSAEGAVT